jgi:hypothetical protein
MSEARDAHATVVRIRVQPNQTTPHETVDEA